MALLQSVMIRHTKAQRVIKTGAPLLDLPKTFSQFLAVELGVAEDDAALPGQPHAASDVLPYYRNVGNSSHLYVCKYLDHHAAEQAAETLEVMDKDARSLARIETEDALGEVEARRLQREYTRRAKANYRRAETILRLLRNACTSAVSPLVHEGRLNALFRGLVVSQLQSGMNVPGAQTGSDGRQSSSSVLDVCDDSSPIYRQMYNSMRHLSVPDALRLLMQARQRRGIGIGNENFVYTGDAMGAWRGTDRKSKRRFQCYVVDEEWVQGHLAPPPGNKH